MSGESQVDLGILAVRFAWESNYSTSGTLPADPAAMARSRLSWALAIGLRRKSRSRVTEHPFRILAVPPALRFYTFRASEWRGEMTVFVDGSTARFNSDIDAVEIEATQGGNNILCHVPRSLIEAMFADEPCLPRDLLVPLVQSEFLTVAAAVSRKSKRGEVEPDGTLILRAEDFCQGS